MISFDKWLNSQGKDTEINEDDLPDGITERDGKFYADCCRCERETEIYCDISEIPNDGYEHYCGGSPRCCP